MNDDDDLVAISLSVDTPKCNDKVRLVIEQPAIIKVWSSEQKEEEIENGEDWLACDEYPETLWVEGRIVGNAKLRFEYLGGPAERIVPPTPEIQFTVVDVDILYCYSSIVMYTGDHAGDSPTLNCVAHGDPHGGTYSWQCSTTDTGMLGIVSGQNTDTANVKGVAASSSAGDAKITVSYTLGGCTVQETGTVTVRRPAITGSYRGQFYWGYTAWRNYFHPVGDQFSQRIYLTGMPCDEEIKCIYGEDTDVTSPGSTRHWGDEKYPPYEFANWPGGVAIKDILGCPTLQMPNSKYEQEISVGGWLTGPTYEIYMQPLESDPWPCIWKNP